MGLLKLMKIQAFVLIAIILFTMSCAVKPAVVDDRQPQTEGQIITTIYNLPEVLKANTQIRRTSRGKQHLVVYISGRPSESQSFYSVKVPKYDSTAGDVVYSFILYPKTNKIYYLDPKHARYIALADWRKQKNYAVVNN